MYYFCIIFSMLILILLKIVLIWWPSSNFYRIHLIGLLFSHIKCLAEGKEKNNWYLRAKIDRGQPRTRWQSPWETYHCCHIEIKDQEEPPLLRYKDSRWLGKQEDSALLDHSRIQQTISAFKPCRLPKGKWNGTVYLIYMFCGTGFWSS